MNTIVERAIAEMERMLAVDRRAVSPDEWDTIYDGLVPPFPVSPDIGDEDDGEGYNTLAESQERDRIQKTEPALPFEAHHTKSFNAQEAWEATRAMCRGG